MTLSLADAAKPIALIEDSRSFRYVADRLHKSVGSVHRAVKRFREHQTYSRIPGSGHSRATSRVDDRFILLQALRDRHTTAVQLRNRLQQVRGVNVSERTVRRRLYASGLKAQRSAIGPKLEVQLRVSRLAFTQQHTEWTTHKWTNLHVTED